MPKKGAALFILLLVFPVAARAGDFSRQQKEEAFLAITQAFQKSDHTKAKNLCTQYLTQSHALVKITRSNSGWRKLLGKNISLSEAKVQYSLAEALAGLGEFQEAKEWFESVAISHPRGELAPSAWFRAGECLFNLGQYQKSLETFQRLQDRRPPSYLNSELGTSVALCQERLGQPVEPGAAKPTLSAIASHKQFQETHPHDAASPLRVLLVGEMFYDLGQYEMALEHFQKALAAQKEPFYSQYMMGLCLFQKKDFIKALNVFQDLTRKSSADPSLAEKTKFMEAECFFRMDHLPDAADRFLALAASQDIFLAQEALFKRVLILAKMGYYDRAVSELHLTEQSPNKLRLLQAYCLHQQKEYEKALAGYQFLLDYASEGEILDKALYLMAAVYTERKDYNILVTQYQNTLRSARAGIKQDDKTRPALWRPKAYLLVAEAYYALGRHHEALLVYEAVAESYPSLELAALALSGQAACRSHLAQDVQARQTTERLAKRYSQFPEVASSTDLMMANTFFNEGKFQEALAAYEKALSRAPQDSRVSYVLYQKGASLARLQHYSQAISVWENLVLRFPQDPMAWKALDQASRTAFGLGHYDQAISFNKKLLEAPETTLAQEAAIRIAQCRFNAKNYRQAIEAYEAYLARYPEDARKKEVLEGIQTSYFQLAQSSSKPEAVLEEFAERFKDEKMAGEAYWRLGAAAYEKKDFSQASSYFGRVVSQYSHAESAKGALYYLAESQYQAGRLEEAITSYRTFLASFPQDDLAPAARFHLANALFKNEKLEESAYEYQVLADSAPASTEAPHALLNMALVYQKLNKFPQSILAYKSFLKRYPDNPEKNFAAFQTALLSQEIGDYAGALSFYQVTVSAKDISATELQCRIAECHAKLNQVDQAIESYQKLISMKPADDPYRFQGLLALANLYESRGNNAEVLKIYRELAQSTKDQEIRAALQYKIGQLNRGVR